MTMDKISRGSRIWEAHGRSPRSDAAGASPRSDAGALGASPSLSCLEARPRSPTPPAAGQRSPQRPLPPMSPLATLRSSRSAWSQSQQQLKLAGEPEPAGSPRGAQSPRGSPRSLASSPAATPPSRTPGRNPANVSFGLTPLPSARETRPELKRMRSEPSWLMSPRSQATDGLASSPRSPRSPRRRSAEYSPQSCMVAVTEVQRPRRATEACHGSPGRGTSPTFRTSPDFCLEATTTTQEALINAVADRGAASPLSPRRMRQQAGRITEMSQQWFETENVGPAPGLIANSFDYNISRGKKTDFVRHPDSVAGRMHLDATQPDLDIPKTQRRHEFEVAAPRRQGLARCTSADALLQPQARRENAMMREHRTTACMAASLRPDAAAAPPPTSHSVIGDARDAPGRRRGIADCARFAVQQGTLQSTFAQAQVAQASPRDMHASSTMKEFFQPQTVVVRQAPAVVFASPAAALPVSHLSQSSSRTHAIMSKDLAYGQGGAQIVNYTPRGIGLCSPNAPRTPVSRILRL